MILEPPPPAPSRRTWLAGPRRRRLALVASIAPGVLVAQLGAVLQSPFVLACGAALLIAAAMLHQIAGGFSKSRRAREPSLDTAQKGPPP